MRVERFDFLSVRTRGLDKTIRFQSELLFEDPSGVTLELDVPALETAANAT